MNIVFELNEKTGKKIVWSLSEDLKGNPVALTFVGTYYNWVQNKILSIENFVETWEPHLNNRDNDKFIIKSMLNYKEKRSTTKERWRRRKLNRSVNDMGIKKVRNI